MRGSTVLAWIIFTPRLPSSDGVGAKPEELFYRLLILLGIFFSGRGLRAVVKKVGEGKV